MRMIAHSTSIFHISALTPSAASVVSGGDGGPMTDGPGRRHHYKEQSSVMVVSAPEHIERAVSAWQASDLNNLRVVQPTLVLDERIEAGPIVAVRHPAGWLTSVDVERAQKTGLPMSFFDGSSKWLSRCLDYEECLRARKMISERFPHLVERANRFHSSLMSLRAIWNDGVAEEQRKARAR